MAKMVGLSRAIKMEWLNRTVSYVLEGHTETEIKNLLQDYLSFEIESPTVLRKTREILMNIWVYPIEGAEDIRKIALDAYKREKSNKLALHWSMILLAYPIFSDITGLIGKLSTIQDTFTTGWLREKIYEEWGERATLLHSSAKLLQILVYLDAIERVKTGVYRIRQYPVFESETIRVIVMTALTLRLKAYYELTEISNIPQFYPFVFEVSHEWIYSTGYFKLTNFGGKAVLMEE